MRPIEITPFSDTALFIRWDDGHESIYTFQELREHCPCAACREQEALHVPDASLLGWEPVGHYAVQFRFAEGVGRHDAGIYTFKRLRELCPCEACEAQRQKNEE